jgi:hypothetical protein
MQVRELQPKNQDQNFEVELDHQKMMVIKERQGYGFESELMKLRLSKIGAQH